MSKIYIDVDVAIEVFVNLFPLIDDTDFKSFETGIVYNQAGMDLVWNFQTSGGVVTQTAVTPTTAGDYDWSHVGDAMYKIEIPASGGASINNAVEGVGWFTGKCTGVLGWASPKYCFRAAALNNALIDGGDLLDVNITHIADTSQTANDNGADINTVLTRLTAVRAGYLDELAAANLPTDITSIIAYVDELETRLSATRAGYLDNLNIGGLVASSAEATAIQNNTRIRVIVPQMMERPDSGSTAFKLHLYIYDEAGNMEAPDSTPTITAENETGTDRSSNLGTVTLEATGHYSVTYTLSVGDNIEQLLFKWTVTEGAVARLHGSTTQVVDTTAVDFTAADRTKLEALETRLTTLRAGYIDNLSAGAAALEATAQNIPTNAELAARTLLSTDYFDPAADAVATVTSLTNKTGFSLASTGLDAIVSTAVGMVEIAKAIYDRVLTAGTHNIPNSGGKRIRAINDNGTYSGGYIYIDTINGTAGTTDGENGTDRVPVDSIADANALAISLGINKFMIASSSSIVLPQDYTNFIFDGNAWDLNLNSKVINTSSFFGAHVIGASSTTTHNHFDRCLLGAVTLSPGTYRHCGFGESGGVFTANLAGEYTFYKCFSAIAGAATPSFVFSGLGSATGISSRGWVGGSDYTLDNNCTVSQEVDVGGGQSFSGGGNIELRGLCRSINITLGTATSETVQIIATTGPIVISGTPTAAIVNIHGISTSLTDTSTGSTVTDNTLKGSTVNSIVTDTTSILTKLPFRPTKGVAFNNYKFLMVLSSDHVTGATGLTVSGIIQKDTGSFAAITNSVVEIASGMYRVTLTATEMNADSIVLIFTADTADARVITIYPQTS